MSQSVERAVELIRRCARQPMSLADAADAIGTHKSTALRILQVLEAAEFVRHTSAGTYTVGTGLTALLEPPDDVRALQRAADPLLHRLHEHTGAPVRLAEYTGHEVICIREYGVGAGAHRRTGGAFALTKDASGRVILAYQDRPSRDRLLSFHELDWLDGPRTWARDALEVELARIRSAGWASDAGERRGATIAAPIRNERGVVIAAASIEVAAVVDRTPARELLQALLEATVSISRVLANQGRARETTALLHAAQ